ncbi:AEC family transporter [Thalassospira sp. MA62]|nr:AEC family transporter [Thalassospira sp. MA62]
MLDTLAITAPIFMIIALGYFAVQRQIIPQAVVRGMGAFVINFALPSLLLSSVVSRDLGEILNVSFLLAYGGGSVIVFAIGFLFARLVAHKPQENASLQGMGMSLSNSGFVGYPIMVQVLGPPAGIALALCFIVENLIMTPLGLFLCDSAKTTGVNYWHILGKTFMRLCRTPVIVSIVTGLVISAFGITIPAPIHSVVDMLASASAPVALFVIGGGLVGLRIKGLRFDMARIVFGKLILHPLVIFILILMTPNLDPTMRLAAVCFACAPMFSVFPIYGFRYGHEGLTAASLMMATLASFVTISMTLWVLDHTAVLGPLP